MNDITIIAGNNPFIVTVLASLLGTFLALCLFGALRVLVKKLIAAKAQSDKSEEVKPSDDSGEADEADDKQEAASEGEPKTADNEADTPDASEKADDKESVAQN